MEKLLEKFKIEGRPLSCEKYGSGHINRTFLVKTDSGKKYILQKINTDIFKDIDMLMRNIALITQYLKKVSPDYMKVLTLVETFDGKLYYKSDNDECWRMYDFIEHSVCLDRPESADDFYQSAVAFGQFANLLSGFDASLLGETIPNFHNTIERYKQLKEAIKNDVKGRASSVADEIDFAMSREQEAGQMVRMMQEGKLPVRVTHNDTKLNNVLFNDQTRKPLCVVDLDSVMPGLIGNDFGDSIRFGASTAAEDEIDLDKVKFDINMYDSYAKGFLSTCKDSLTKAEIDTLPLAAKLMTLECGTRFLADYLNGDVYFATSRPNHNLDRARTQFKLVSEMEREFDNMKAIVHKYAEK